MRPILSASVFRFLPLEEEQWEEIQRKEGKCEQNRDSEEAKMPSTHLEANQEQSGEKRVSGEKVANYSLWS